MSSINPAITQHTKRELPRRFKLHWGEGLVTEEASIRCELPDEDSWEPTIQILKFENGEEELRFCVYDGKRLTRWWPLLYREALVALGKQVKKNPGIERMLSYLVEGMQ
jgi:hypothetical protein